MKVLAGTPAGVGGLHAYPGGVTRDGRGRSARSVKSPFSSLQNLRAFKRALLGETLILIVESLLYV